MVFLDNAATSYLKPPGVYRAVRTAMHTCASVGRGGYDASMAAAEQVFGCREAVAQLYGLSGPEAVSFTYNATVALNMAIKGMPVKRAVAISGYEHNAVVRPLKAIEERGVTAYAASSPLFRPDIILESFRRILRQGVELVVCNHVSNVFGYILPVAELDAMCAEFGVPLIIDDSQGAGVLRLNAGQLKATAFICMAGHKSLYGPQGTGILLCLRPEGCSTLIEGGTGSDSASYQQPSFLPDRFESGTHNVAGIAGLRQGVEFVLMRTPEWILHHEQTLVNYAAQRLAEIPELTVYHSPEHQAGVLSFRHRELPCEQIAAALSSGGICVRAGLHCAPLAHRTAGTFSTGTVRISPSVFSTRADMDRLLNGVRAAVRSRL